MIELIISSVLSLFVSFGHSVPLVAPVSSSMVPSSSSIMQEVVSQMRARNVLYVRTDACAVYAEQEGGAPSAFAVLTPNMPTTLRQEGHVVALQHMTPSSLYASYYMGTEITEAPDATLYFERGESSLSVVEAQRFIYSDGGFGIRETRYEAPYEMRWPCTPDQSPLNITGLDYGFKTEINLFPNLESPSCCINDAQQIKVGPNSTYLAWLEEFGNDPDTVLTFEGGDDSLTAQTYVLTQTIPERDRKGREHLTVQEIRIDAATLQVQEYVKHHVAHVAGVGTSYWSFSLRYTYNCPQDCVSR